MNFKQEFVCDICHITKKALNFSSTFLLFYVDKLAIAKLTKDFSMCKSGLYTLSGETKLVNMFARITLVVFVFIVMVSYPLSIVTTITFSILSNAVFILFI